MGVFEDNSEINFNFLIPGFVVVDVVLLLFYVHGKHLKSCPDDQLT